MKNLILFFVFILFSLQGFAQDIDPNQYYRLTTAWQGEGKSLDIVNDGENNKPILAKTGDYSGQMWKFTPIKDGYYRLTTQWQGEGKSLDIINDGENNKPTLAKTGNYSGQAWKLTPLGRGFYRLTTAWQGEGKSLDIINDGENNKPILAHTGNYSGQSWKLTSLTSNSKPTTSTNTKPMNNRRETTRQKPTPNPKPATKTRTATKLKPTPNTKTSNNTNINASISGVEQMENDIMKMVNDHRQKMGLNPLQFDPIIRRYSREHSIYMKAKGRISHDDFQGRMGKMSSEVGSTSMEGENVAMNSSAKGAFEAWMNSSGHRTNIEKPAFTHAALGVVEKSGGMYYLTHIFIAKR